MKEEIARLLKHVQLERVSHYTTKGNNPCFGEMPLVDSCVRIATGDSFGRSNRALYRLISFSGMHTGLILAVKQKDEMEVANFEMKNHQD